MEGSGHPNFMNPFVYGKSLLGKSFPKRIGTLTLPNPKIFRGGTMCPPPRSLIRQNRPGRIGLRDLREALKTIQPFFSVKGESSLNPPDVFGKKICKGVGWGGGCKGYLPFGHFFT